MYTFLPQTLSSETVDRIVKDAEDISTVSEKRHFIDKGKNFFETYNGIQHLKAITKELNDKYAFSSHMKNPVIQHAYLLYKSAGGPATHMHQDRPYWTNIEENPTMVTAWFFLEDIGAENGCLKLNPKNAFDVEKKYRFNENQKLYEHEESKTAKGFSKIIVEKQAKKLEPALTPVEGSKGDLVIFDGFEVHESTVNVSDETRKAMKLVIGDNLENYAFTLDELLNKSAYSLYLKSSFQAFKRKILKAA